MPHALHLSIETWSIIINYLEADGFTATTNALALVCNNLRPITQRAIFHCLTLSNCLGVRDSPPHMERRIELLVSILQKNPSLACYIRHFHLKFCHAYSAWVHSEEMDFLLHELKRSNIIRFAISSTSCHGFPAPFISPAMLQQLGTTVRHLSLKHVFAVDFNLLFTAFQNLNSIDFINVEGDLTDYSFHLDQPLPIVQFAFTSRSRPNTTFPRLDTDGVVDAVFIAFNFASLQHADLSTYSLPDCDMVTKVLANCPHLRHIRLNVARVFDGRSILTHNFAYPTRHLHNLHLWSCMPAVGITAKDAVASFSSVLSRLYTCTLRHIILEFRYNDLADFYTILASTQHWDAIDRRLAHHRSHPLLISIILDRKCAFIQHVWNNEVVAKLFHHSRFKNEAYSFVSGNLLPQHLRLLLPGCHQNQRITFNII